MNGRFTPWLKIEGLVVLVVTVVVYRQLGGGWRLFAGLLLAPDASALGYLAGNRVGAWSYNLVHTYATALTAGLTAHLLGVDLALQIALIWTAHIAFDRALGYGLKSPEGFKHTHLNTLGSPEPS